MKNSCYTYFRISGIFDPDVVSSLLNLTPYDSHRTGDTGKNGTIKYDFDTWDFGRCDIYDVEVEKQMLTTIKPLLRKIDILKKIKQIYDVVFVLEVVPTVHPNESAPCLAPSLEIMQFCCETGTTIDIDLYVC